MDINQNLIEPIFLSNKAKNLSNKQFGRLTVLYPVDKHYRRGSIIWRCECSCGNRRNIGSYSLLNGGTNSCGCIKACRLGSRGMSKHPLYATWKGMLSRCYNPKAANYKNYGGKGITVCTAWHNFKTFLESAPPKPPEFTLDRINPNDNYMPSNCRWASRKLQANNKKKSSNKDKT